MKKKLINQAFSIVEKELVERRISKNPKMQFKHWTFIYDGRGKIVSWGQNSQKTHPLARKHGHRASNIHSELMAYISLPDRLKNYNFVSKCVFLNIRVNNKMEIRRSAPCKCCKNFLFAIGVRQIYYTIDDEKKLLLQEF